MTNSESLWLLCIWQNLAGKRTTSPESRLEGTGVAKVLDEAQSNLYPDANHLPFPGIRHRRPRRDLLLPLPPPARTSTRARPNQYRGPPPQSRRSCRRICPRIQCPTRRSRRRPRPPSICLTLRQARRTFRPVIRHRPHHPPTRLAFCFARSCGVACGLGPKINPMAELLQCSACHHYVACSAEQAESKIACRRCGRSLKTVQTEPVSLNRAVNSPKGTAFLGWALIAVGIYAILSPMALFGLVILACGVMVLILRKRGRIAPTESPQQVDAA